LEANGLEPKETVPASRKLGRDDARALAAKAGKLIVAKGKKVTRFETKGGPSDEALDAMLGPTGNLRAPTLRSGKTLLVGFNEDEYRSVLIG
jgi:arsenate reductase-like glutaredoxin family protein